MANWYCDISLIAGSASYNATPTAAGTVPTKPEDGNGKGSGVAAMATLVITFTGIPNADETITIAGVTFTAKASGATGTQFNAVTDATTCATNLKNAINASTTNAVQPASEINATAPLRNIVNATSSAGVVTVYTRHGSAAWNSVTENETLTNAVITTQWSGGADGAWGYIFNPAAIAWPGSVAAGAHGAWVNTYLGQPAAGDVVHMRTKAGGANLSLTGFGGSSVTVNTRDIGSVTSFINYRADNGAIWTSDGNGILTIDKSATGGTTAINWKGFTKLTGNMQSGTLVTSGGVVNMGFKVSATESSGYPLTNVMSAVAQKQTIFEAVKLRDDGNGSYVGAQCLQLSYANVQVSPLKPPTLINCELSTNRAAPSWFAQANAYAVSHVLIDPLFSFGNFTYAPALQGTAIPNYACHLTLIRPKFTGGNGGAHALVDPPAAPGYPYALIIHDPVDMGQFGSIAYGANSVCHQSQPASGSGLCGECSVGQWVTPGVNGREMLIDTPLRLIEMKSGFPTTGNSLFSDGTAFSLRFSVPYTGLTTGLVTRENPQRSMKMVATNTLGDVVDLTLTLHALIDSTYGGSSYTPADNDWWIEAQYVSGGVVKLAHTKGTGSAVASDTQSWSSTTYSPFGGSSRSYSKWKFPLNITDVDADTDIIMHLVCAKQPSLTNELCFYCPQFQVALT